MQPNVRMANVFQNIFTATVKTIVVTILTSLNVSLKKLTSSIIRPAVNLEAAVKYASRKDRKGLIASVLVAIINLDRLKMQLVGRSKDNI